MDKEHRERWNIYVSCLLHVVFSGQLNGALVVLYWQSELHKNCSSVSELATIASSGSGSHQPSLPSLHTDMDCSWKPFGLYLLDS